MVFCRDCGRIAALTAVLLLQACAGRLPESTVDRPPAVELAQVPFFAQTAYQCGPAALSTVLVHAGVNTSPEQLADQVYIPGRQGSLQAELVAATRRSGRLAVILPAQIAALQAALHAGYPVLILQNLGLDAWPRWHYAVVVGYDPIAEQMILRSGTAPRAVESMRRFEARWTRAGRWAMVAAVPEHPVEAAGPLRWVAAAADLEALGQADLAERAYRAATATWPAQALPYQALANVRYARRDLAGAATALRQALALADTPAVRNNLAQVLIEQGCAAQAAALLADIDGDSLTPSLQRAFADTRRQLDGVDPAVAAAGC